MTDACGALKSCTARIQQTVPRCTPGYKREREPETETDRVGHFKRGGTLTQGNDIRMTPGMTVR